MVKNISSKIILVLNSILSIFSLSVAIRYFALSKLILGAIVIIISICQFSVTKLTILKHRVIFTFVSIIMFFVVSLIDFNIKKSGNVLSKNVNLLQEVQESKSPNLKQYIIFNNKLSINSSVKPFEEDATISKLSRTFYTDVKNYSFLDMLKPGMMTIIIAEFKEMDSSFDAEEHLNDLIKQNENREDLKVSFPSRTTISTSSFKGYYTFAKMSVNEKESSYLYLGALTDKQIVISVIAVYDTFNSINVVNDVLYSMKRNK